VEEWVGEHLETLRHVLGAEVVAQDFTDDRILHVLGQLGEETARRWEQMEHQLGVHLVQAFALPRETARTDTTTFVLYHGEGGTLARFGHSKDRRPDLRQFKVVLSTLDPLGLPLLTEALAGNVADDGVYVRAWERMSAVLGGPDFVLVADCKFSSLANRGQVACGEGIYYAPLPGTGKVPEIIREWVLGEGFQAQEIRWSPLAAGEESA
jgi:transposase